MDKASLIGVIIGVLCLGIVAVEVSHGNFAMFFSMEGLLMVGGGSVSVVFMSMPLEAIASAEEMSTDLISCRQTMSGEHSLSQARRGSSRCRTELTFQVAMRMAGPTITYNLA